MGIMRFQEYTEGKNEYRIPLIDRSQTMIAAFIDVDNVIAVFQSNIVHADSVRASMISFCRKIFYPQNFSNQSPAACWTFETERLSHHAATIFILMRELQNSFAH
ncbi:MAG TPA: hypothetical protein VLG76_04045 [Rhabdochlamydiaceae bacterium]|nr:hypothetical protein [Rhabdochlamydiaceae bacterium]HSX37789.1 hypothetical protein [Chlamydiales bacterium]